VLSEKQDLSNLVYDTLTKKIATSYHLNGELLESAVATSTVSSTAAASSSAAAATAASTTTSSS
jgi:hypothetical protein